MQFSLRLSGPRPTLGLTFSRCDAAVPHPPTGRVVGVPFRFAPTPLGSVVGMLLTKVNECADTSRRCRCCLRIVKCPPKKCCGVWFLLAVRWCFPAPLRRFCDDFATISYCFGGIPCSRPKLLVALSAVSVCPLELWKSVFFILHCGGCCDR